MASITILGGGVAGLALAATLDPVVHDVTLVERSPGHSRVPTTFGIWPFALAALERIGLAEALREGSHLLAAGVITADSAHRPVTMTMRDPGVRVIPRPGLIQLLDAAVPASVVREHNRVADPDVLPGDLVIGADGARSVVREHIWRDRPRDTGVVAIRGVTPNPPQGPLDRMHEFWGDGMLFGVGPDPLPSGIGTNWYASARRGEESPERALEWARTAFADFPEPVRDALAAATPEQTVVNTILESRPIRRLARDRYVLIGDAAHAMSPNLGRGACEAMVDGITLGTALNAHGLSGIDEYSRRRLRAGQRTRSASAMMRRLSLSRRPSRAFVSLAGHLARR